MRLEPIAKPIRIRIKLGQNECSSLISLQNSFSVEELYPLFKDGRLERWLMQVGETKLANDVNSISKQCGDGSDVYDNICLISLFFNEVTQVVKDVQLENKKSSIDDFFKKASIEALATIYKYTKEIASFKWKKIIDQILNNKNIKTLFEHERLHEIFSDESEWGLRFKNSTTDYKDYTKFIIYLRDIVKNNQKHENVLIGYIKACEKEYGGEEVIFRDLDLDTILQDWYSYPVLRDYLNIDWSKIVRKKLSNNIDKAIILYKSPEYSGILGNSWGEVFAGLIQSDSDYKKIFDFIEKISKEPGDYETLIKDFINQSRDRGYRWEKVYKDRLSLGYISRIYTNKYLQEMNLDWVKMFSNSIKKWDEERDKVLGLLKANSSHLESFCKKCAEYGYPVVEEKEIPWYVLANGTDFDVVINALNDYTRGYYKKTYCLNEVQTDLGKQILNALMYPYTYRSYFPSNASLNPIISGIDSQYKVLKIKKHIQDHRKP